MFVCLLMIELYTICWNEMEGRRGTEAPSTGSGQSVISLLQASSLVDLGHLTGPAWSVLGRLGGGIQTLVAVWDLVSLEQ